jgi:hypothetical protein
MWPMFTRIQALDRKSLIAELLHFQGRVRLDFTAEFLQTRSDEQLRHLLAAAYLQSEQAGDLVAAG